METERITLSQRERDRLKVLHEVQQKHLTQVAAAARLKVTDRQVRPCHQTATRHHQTLTRHGHLSVSQQDQYLPGIYFRGLLLALRRTHGGSLGMSGYQCWWSTPKLIFQCPRALAASVNAAAPRRGP